MNTHSQNTPRAMPGVTWTNGNVAIAKDIVFGLCVMSEQGWYPFNMLDKADRRIVLRAIDWNPSCIYLQELQELNAKLSAEEAAKCPA